MFCCQIIKNFWYQVSIFTSCYRSIYDLLSMVASSSLLGGLLHRKKYGQICTDRTVRCVRLPRAFVNLGYVGLCGKVALFDRLIHFFLESIVLCLLFVGRQPRASSVLNSRCNSTKSSSHCNRELDLVIARCKDFSLFCSDLVGICEGEGDTGSHHSVEELGCTLSEIFGTRVRFTGLWPRHLTLTQTESCCHTFV